MEVSTFYVPILHLVILIPSLPRTLLSLNPNASIRSIISLILKVNYEHLLHLRFLTWKHWWKSFSLPKQSLNLSLKQPLPTSFLHIILLKFFVFRNLLHFSKKLSILERHHWDVSDPKHHHLQHIPWRPELLVTYVCLLCRPLLMDSPSSYSLPSTSLISLINRFSVLLPPVYYIVPGTLPNRREMFFAEKTRMDPLSALSSRCECYKRS